MTQVHDRLITSNSTAAYKPQSKTVSQMVFGRRRLSNLNWRQQGNALIEGERNVFLPSTQQPK
jgi:hypothetical protein